METITYTPELTQEEKAKKWDELYAQVKPFFEFDDDGCQIKEGDCIDVGRLTIEAMGF